MKKLSFLILAFIALTLHSCLKERDQVLNPDNVNSVVEFGSVVTPSHAATDSFRVYALSYNISPLDTVELVINYAGYNAAPKDIVVSLALNNQLLANYNKVKGTSYSLLPSAVYTLPSSVTIKQGAKSTKLLIPIKVDQISLNGTFVLPLQITDASGETISRNFGSSIFIIAPKNKYDGQYEVTGTYIDLAAPVANTARYPKTINLVTQSANSNGYFDINLNGGLYGYTFFASGSGSYYGNFAAVFIFDDNGNVGVTNYYGQTNSSNRAVFIDPTGVNKITFGSNGLPLKMEVSYFMNQAGVRRLEIKEMFTYKGPR
jgi:hypothetical protein